MKTLFIVLFIICSYLLGSVPFGFILARAVGVDIKKRGSGNIGATNVFRSVSKKLGIFVFILDVLKGLVPVCISRYAFGSFECLPLVCGAVAIAGHNWPIYLKFKGGKGVATSAGALLGIAPLTVLVGIASWAIIFLLSGYVSLASVIAAAIVGIVSWLLYIEDGLLLPMILSFLAFVIVIRHTSNIKRLITGTENRFNLWKNRKKSV